MKPGAFPTAPSSVFRVSGEDGDVPERVARVGHIPRSESPSGSGSSLAPSSSLMPCTARAAEAAYPGPSRASPMATAAPPAEYGGVEIRQKFHARYVRHYGAA